mgnify:CR=1 FL=1
MSRVCTYIHTYIHTSAMHASASRFPHFLFPFLSFFVVLAPPTQPKAAMPFDRTRPSFGVGGFYYSTVQRAIVWWEHVIGLWEGEGGRQPRGGDAEECRGCGLRTLVRVQSSTHTG